MAADSDCVITGTRLRTPEEEKVILDDFEFVAEASDVAVGSRGALTKLTAWVTEHQDMNFSAHIVESLLNLAGPHTRSVDGEGKTIKDKRGKLVTAIKNLGVDDAITALTLCSLLGLTLWKCVGDGT